MSSIQAGEEQQMVRSKKLEKEEAGLGVLQLVESLSAGRKSWVHKNGTLKPIIPAPGRWR